MRKRLFMMPRWARVILFPVLAAAFLAIVGLAVMQLWNYLLPDLLHVSAINFWQAIGLFVLCKILFGFGRPGRFGGGRFNRDSHRMAERFRDMSTEDRERFKKQFGEHFFDRRHRKWATEAAAETASEQFGK